MKCLRCGQKVDTSIPELNADNYGDNVWACPECGQAYRFFRTVRCCPIDTDRKADDWGKKIVRNSRKYKDE